MKLILAACILLLPEISGAAPMKIVTSKGRGFQLSQKATVRELVRLGSSGLENTKEMKDEEARSIESRVLRLIWSAARRPRVPGKCRLYATLEANGEKAKVCEKDRKTTGRVFGLLQELDSKF